VYREGTLNSTQSFSHCDSQTSGLCSFASAVCAKYHSGAPETMQKTHESRRMTSSVLMKRIRNTCELCHSTGDLTVIELLTCEWSLSAG